MRLSDSVIFKLLLTTHVVFIFLFFDPKLHVGGDDADYIRSSMDFLSGKSFPSWHGSFYPIAISPFIALFGNDLLLLKIVTVSFSIISFVLFRETFYHRVPSVVLHFALAMYAVCYSMAAYSSTTYSEPLFMLFQSLAIYFLFKLIESKDRNIHPSVALGVSLFFLGITRNIGLAAPLSVFVFLSLNRQWRNQIYTGMVLFACHFIYFLIKRIYWGVDQVGIEGQLSRIRFKNFYNEEQGIEDNLGLLNRLWENSTIYLSNHVLKFIGLKAYDSLTFSSFVTSLMIVGILYFIVMVYKRNKYLHFSGLYCVLMMVATFVTQQQHWNQERLVLVYLPFLVLILGFSIYLFKEFLYEQLKFCASIVLIGLPILCMVRTLSMEIQVVNALANLGGNKYKGYPERFKSYSQISEWAGSNIPESLSILCRKQGIASVYGGRDFIGITTYKHNHPDSADALLSTKNISYILADSFQDMNAI